VAEDIFDQVAASATPASGGDIFDQVSKSPDAAATPVAPQKDTVADFERSQTQRISSAPIAPGFPTQPRLPFGSTYNPADAAVEQGSGPDYALKPNAPAPTTIGQQVQSIKAGNTLTPTARAPLSQPSTRVGGEQVVDKNQQPDKFGAADLAAVGTGAEPLIEAGKAAVSAGKDLYEGAGKTLGQTGENFDKAKFVKGITQLVSGGSKAAIALTAPELMELGAAADAGNVAAQGSIIKILASAEAGNIASDVGGKAADKLNLSPETKDLIQTAAFFLPTLAGAMSFKGGVGVDAEGNPGVGVSSKGGKVRAGAVGTPEAFDIRAQVGGTRFGVKIPRGSAPPPPDPAQVLGAQEASAGTNAIMRAAQKEAQAKTVVAGGPQPPPPGPAMPASMQSGVILPKTVQDIATMIHMAPPEQHAKLLMEAHGKLTEYIQKQGRIIGPDGKLQIAETPQQAAKLAQNIINDEVDRQQTAKEDAAKQQAEVAKQQEKQQKEQEKAAKEATTPGKDGELSPADQQWQRAKTIIESTTPKKGQTIQSVLQRSLQVSPATADQMVERHAKETASAALPTVGTKKEPVVEESRATVDAQVSALKRGDINVVMLPEGSRYRPAVPDGMKIMGVKGDVPGAGLYLYNPKKVQAPTIRDAAKAGTHGDLMGHVQSKAAIDAEPTKQPVVVQAQAKDGTPIQDSVVHPERVEAQKEAMQERHPDADIVTKHPDEVIQDRVKALAEEHPETAKGDIFDEVAKTALAETEPAKEVGKSAKKEVAVAKIKEQSEAGNPPNQKGLDAMKAPATEMKFEHGSTQTTINKGSDAGKALESMRRSIPDADLDGKGRDVGESHVTVRYGLTDSEVTPKLRKFIEGLTPFEAKLGKTDAFPPSTYSDGASAVYAKIEAPQLTAINDQIGDHAAFKKSDFSSYIPHATVAYVKPEAAGKYKGMTDAEGRTFPIDHIEVSDKNGDVTKIQMKGKHSKDVAKQEATPQTKGKRVAFTDRDGVEREGIIVHSGDRITRIGKYDMATSKVGEERPELKPGQVGRMAVSELHLDPKRFQYKVSVGEGGVNDLLTGKKWNDELAGVTSVWRDPENGKVYVVNGHHRATLAKQSKTGNLPVRMLDAKDATEARSIGALQNIAEGRGTALDAAKFLRDSGIGLDDLEAKGISMGEATAQNGVALSRLDSRLFDMVVAGKMTQGRGVAIGRETGDAATQDAILTLIDKAEKRGKKINDGTVEELARFAQTAPQRQETVASLFGDEDRTTSMALEKAEISAYAKRQMSTEKRVFGAVSTDAKAKTLGATGKNKIDAASNAAMATGAEQAMEVYDKLSARRGPIDDILNRAAEELSSARPTDIAAVKQRAYEDIRSAVSEALGSGQGTGVGRDEETADGPPDEQPDKAALEEASQTGFFTPREPELTLPGMEDDVARQKESAAEVKVEGEKEAIEAALTNPKDNISKATGEMERESPLFRDSEASGQGGLFGAGDTDYLHGGLGIAAGALKPLAQIKPVADVLAFLGDEADRVAVSRDLHNRLYDMASQDNAAVLRVVQMLKAMPGTAKDQQAIYHHIEDPKSVTLTDEQQSILDDYLTPLIYHAERDFQVVTEGGIPLENYVHRQVRDRGGMIDRIMERAKEGIPTSGVGGGRLTKTAPAAKHRTMMAIEDAKTGKRQVVSIKGGRVAVVKNGQPPQDIGGLRSGLTTVGDETDKRMAPFVKRVTELRDEISGAKEADRQEQLGLIEPRIAELKAQMAALENVRSVTGYTKPNPEKLFDRGSRPIYSKEATFRQRAEISKKLDPLLKREEGLKAGTFPMMAKNVAKLERSKAELKGAEAFRDAALNELPPETFADKAWKDKHGGLYKITQATTKEIEANTNVRYYQNAAGSVAVNYLAMDKARRAYDFLEEFKASPEFAAGSHSINSPGAIPKGWQATQLPQFRGYFFEPHIAEVLDKYAAKLNSSGPGVLEQVGNFLRTSIFFNPLIHIPNLLNHWVVEKGVSGFANPLNYPTITRAGVKAINAVIHQNADFLEALDNGAPLQSQQFETKQFADLFFNRMQDELGDPESSKAVEMAKALGMAPVDLVKAIYKFSGKATWYTNDIAFLQSAYEKQEKGMSLKDSLTETAKHIPDYRLMTRIFDSKKLGDLMSNHNLTMFGAYHYGALKSYGQMVKSLTGFNWTDAGTKNEAGEPTNAAGRTEGEEKLHGLDTLAMMALVTFVVYPLLDKLWKMVTGNDKAQMRRAGASTLIYNLALLAKGEKTPEEVAESIATPAVQTKALAEIVLNRDLRTGQRLYDPHAPGKKLASQVGRQLARSVAPVSQGMDIAEGRTDWKRMMYSMVGVSFPLHGAEKIAAQITAERLSSLPPRDEDEIAHAIERSRALHDAWSGDRTRLVALLHGKDFTAKEKAKIRKDVLLPPIVYAVRGMEYSDAVRVYHAANAHERKQLKPMMSKKLARLLKEGKKPEAILGKDDDN
jgi:2'-5' RNA ligase